MCTRESHNGTNVTDKETGILYISSGKASLCCHLGKCHLGIIFHSSSANYLLETVSIYSTLRFMFLKFYKY